jgi:hypothetical protein
MTDLRVYQIDAFTRERYQGNPAGVVANAAGLGDDHMQLIARELNNSETAFVLPAEGPGVTTTASRMVASMFQCGSTKTSSALHSRTPAESSTSFRSRVRHATGSGHTRSAWMRTIPPRKPCLTHGSGCRLRPEDLQGVPV